LRETDCNFIDEDRVQTGWISNKDTKIIQKQFEMNSKQAQTNPIVPEKEEEKDYDIDFH